MKSPFFVILIALTMPIKLSAQLLTIDNGPLYGDNNYSLYGAKWNKPNLKYYNYNNSTHLTASVRETAINNAFETWEENSPLSFQQTNNVNEADIVLQWCTGSHNDYESFDGNGGVLAHAGCPPPVGGFMAGKIHFDDDEDWTAGETGVIIDLESIALHEIGHAIGIAHSSESTAVMFPQYVMGSLKRTLSDDDKSAIWTLYANEGQMMGPTIPGVSSVYSVDGIPNSFSVSWQWKNGSSVIIVQNSPFNNQCTISNSFKSYINDVLVATISKGSIVITTIEKPIRSGANFSGTYKQEGGNAIGPAYYAPIPETTFADNASIYIHREHKVTLKSSLFTNSTVTSSGPNPPLFLMQNGDSITFYAPTTTQAAVYTFTGTNNNGYDVFRFTVRKLKDSLVPVFLGLTHTNGMLSLYFKNESDEVIDARDLQDVDIDVIVASVQTGKTVYQSSQKGVVRDISTRNWESGIYIVQAIVEGQQLTNKIIINQ